MAVINGTAGTDILNGTPSDDAIHGLAGDDVIYGGSGIDQLYGDEGSDQIYGENGDDVFVDDLGDDLMDGGLDNDAFFLGRTSAGGQNIIVGGGGIDTVNLSTSRAGATIDLSNTGFQTVMAGETDQLSSIEVIIGSNYADTLTGSANGDTLLGGDGADLLKGGDGDDLISSAGLQGAYGYGDTSIDIIDGGAGDDILWGDSFDTVIGGTGNDTLQIGNSNQAAMGSQVATVNGGDGADTIATTLANAAIDAGAGDDVVTIVDSVFSISLGSPEGYQDYLTYSPHYYTTLTLGTGADTLKFSMPLSMVVADFDVAADALQSLARPGAQTNLAIYQVYQQGADTVLIYNGTSGGDFDITSTVRLTNVDAEALVARGFAGISQGPVFTLGTDGADTYVGTGAADRYDGAGGNDDISGGAGDDSLRGGAGDDILRPGQGADTVDGGAGTDTVSNVGETTALTIDMRLSTGQISDGVHADTVTNIEALVGSDVADVIQGSDVSGFVFLNGGGGDDTITAGAAGGSFAGGAGADTLNGAAGHDVFVFGAGDSVAAAADTINSFVSGSDVVDLRSLPPRGVVSLVSFGSSALIFAKDTNGVDILQVGVNGAIQASDITVGNGAFGYDIVGSAATNLLNGGSGGDRMYGADGADALSGLLGADQIYGHGGGDILDGGAGDDILQGDDGDDVLLGGSGGDRMIGGAGADTFRYTQALDSTSAGQDVITDFVSGVDHIELNLSVTEVSLVRLGSATFIFANTPNGAMQIGVNSDVNISDLVLQTPRGAYLIGDGDSETLTGGALNDVIQAGDGVDLVSGGGGGDALWGGTGSDTFKYLLASDSNAAGADTIFDFQTGIDHIDLTGLAPTEVSIVRSGGSSFVFINGPGGTSQLAATSDINANDLVLGSNLSTYVIGDDAANTLVSGARTDILQAAGGNDTLIGGGLSDLMWGGAGADVFKYLAATDSNAAGADSIFDFQSGVDKLDLSAVRTGSTDTLGWISSGGSTFVFVDLHGDGVGDMVIQLTNTASFTSNDYIF